MDDEKNIVVADGKHLFMRLRYHKTQCQTADQEW